MSQKFEQLLDYLVNEEMDKANELFHEIVVEKSRDIYENLIKEEESEEVDETKDEEEEEELDETSHEFDLEDSYEVEADPIGGDAADEFGSDVGMGDMGGDEPAGDMDMPADDAEMDASDDVKMDIQSAIDQLQAAFDKLEGGEGDDMPAGDDDFGGDEPASDDASDSDEDPASDDDEEKMGLPENRRVTREYVEKVGGDWEGNAQKAQGKIVGKNTGDAMPTGENAKSVVSSGKGKPTTGADAKNILGGKGGNEGGSNTGTTPNKVNKGITPDSSEKFDKGQGNVPGGHVKLSKIGSEHPGNSKTPGPVGAGKGELAGQTSQGSANSLLKNIK